MAKPFFKKSVVICEISEMVITEIKYSQTTQIVMNEQPDTSSLITIGVYLLSVLCVFVVLLVTSD